MSRQDKSHKNLHAMRKVSKMTRQLYLYDSVSAVPTMEEIAYGAIVGPDDLMRSFGISRRMLQRDLKDLRDSGLINVRYFKAGDRYIDKGDAKFNDDTNERRRQHLKRLHRLGTLIHSLSMTPVSEIDDYESGIREFEEYVELTKEDPVTFPPEDIEMMREFYIHEPPEFYDLKSEYYALFPDSNERTRQRDFKALREAGYLIYYSSKYKTFIFEDDDEE